MSFFGLREWKYCNKNIDKLATLLKSQKQQTIHQNDLTELKHRQNGFSHTHSMQNNGITHKNCTIDKEWNQNSKTCLEFDMRTIDWDEYFFHYLPGIKKYFFKESVIDNRKSIKHYGRYVG